MEPNIGLTLRTDKTGHIEVTVEITPYYSEQEHIFRYELDQSYLPDFLKSIRDVLARLPLKGQP
jgi:hypothetical protein